MIDESREESEYLIEFARRICAAVCSMQMGLAYATFYKSYCKDQKPGFYWIDLANRLIEEQRILAEARSKEITDSINS